MSVDERDARHQPGPLVQLREFTAVDPRSGRVLLDDVNLTVYPGETVLVLGASGAGKSTLLDAIRGTIPHSVPLHTTGVCQVAEQAVAEHTVAQLSRTIGTVPQDPQASICLPNVEDEIALTLENHGVEAGQISARIEQLLAAVGAGHLRHRRNRSLSGGWLQRIATVAALAAEPRLILADEPTSMLDGAGVASVMDLLTALTGQEGALLLVEHRLDELAAGPGLPERTVVVDQGRIVADGETPRVLDEHAEMLDAHGVWTPWSEIDSFPGGGAPVSLQRTPMLSAEGLTVTPERDAAPVLDGLDFSVRAGERIAVMGDNGSGKTTLLLALAGLARHTGQVTGAQPVMVFQNPEHQFLAHTVDDELAFGLPAGTDTAEMAKRFGLTELGEINPFRLSGGEKRRLSVAAGLLAAGHRDGPAVLMADEPTFGLDRATTSAVMSGLANFAAGASGAPGTVGADRAVVIVTHDDALARAWATRIVRVENGQLTDATPHSKPVPDRKPREGFTR